MNLAFNLNNLRLVSFDILLGSDFLGMLDFSQFTLHTFDSALENVNLDCLLFVRNMSGFKNRS